jgi:predicted nucleic acid-binding protein
MAAYCDSNFLARFYLGVGLPRDARSRLEEYVISGRVPVFWLHRLEVVNALQAFVFLTRRGGPWRITAESAAAAHARFREDCGNPDSMLRQTSLSLSDMEAQFEELSLRHTAHHGFRTYDLVHVSAALLLDCDTFWSFDEKANKLAALEGLGTLIRSRRS